jgi:hypothetical protein
MTDDSSDTSDDCFELFELYLQNPGIGDMSWLLKHDEFIGLLSPFGKQVDLTIFPAGPPCGGYYYRLYVYKNIKEITVILQKNGFHFSKHAQKMITTGAVKKQLVSLSNSEIF